MLPILNLVKSYLNISNNNNDDLLEDLINITQVEIENYCKQPIALTTKYLENLLIDGKDLIIPYTTPVSIIKVEYRDYGQSTYTEVDSSSYEYFMNGLVKKLRILNLSYINNLIWRITATVGFDENTLPLDVLNVALQMTVKKFNDSVKGRNDLGKASVSTSQSGASATTSYRDLYPEWYRLLTPYKLIKF